MKHSGSCGRVPISWASARGFIFLIHPFTSTHYYTRSGGSILNMTDKLLTGILNHNQTKPKISTRDDMIWSWNVQGHMWHKPSLACACTRTLVFFLQVLPFSPCPMIGPSHMSWNNLERDIKLNKKIKVLSDRNLLEKNCQYINQLFNQHNHMLMQHCMSKQKYTWLVFVVNYHKSNSFFLTAFEIFCCSFIFLLAFASSP